MSNYKTTSYFYSNFKFLLLTLLIVLSYNLSAQSKKTTTPLADPKTKAAPSQSESKQETKQENQEEINRNREIDAKYQELEKADYSPQEKEKIREEIYKATGRKSPFQTNAFNSKINFKSRYFPTPLLDKYKDVLGQNAPVYLSNIVILNQAISLDFNFYESLDEANKINDLIKDYKFEPKLVLKYILPDLIMTQKYNETSESDKVRNLNLFYQFQPEIYQFLPQEIIQMGQTKEGLSKLAEMQQEFLR